MLAAAKPTAHSVTGSVSSPANAYDGSANDPLTYAQLAGAQTSIGSTTNILTLSTFSPPASFTPQYVKMRVVASVYDNDYQGAYCRGDVSIDGGVNFDQGGFYVDEDTPESFGKVYVYSVNIEGATVADVAVKFKTLAVSGGAGARSSATLQIYDCWIEGTVPGGGFCGAPQLIGF